MKKLDYTQLMQQLSFACCREFSVFGALCDDTVELLLRVGKRILHVLQCSCWRQQFRCTHSGLEMSEARQRSSGSLPEIIIQVRIAQERSFSGISNKGV